MAGKEGNKPHTQLRTVLLAYLMMIDRVKWDYGFNLTIKPHQCDLSDRISEGPL